MAIIKQVQSPLLVDKMKFSISLEAFKFFWNIFGIYGSNFRRTGMVLRQSTWLILHLLAITMIETKFKNYSSTYKGYSTFTMRLFLAGTRIPSIWMTISGCFGMKNLFGAHKFTEMSAKFLQEIDCKSAFSFKSSWITIFPVFSVMCFDLFLNNSALNAKLFILFVFYVPFYITSAIAVFLKHQLDHLRLAILHMNQKAFAATLLKQYESFVDLIELFNSSFGTQVTALLTSSATSFVFQFFSVLAIYNAAIDKHFIVLFVFNSFLNFRYILYLIYFITKPAQRIADEVSF